MISSQESSPRPMTTSAKRRESDLLSHVINFCRSLRERGLLVGPSASADALRCLGLVDLMDSGQVYWAFRALLVSRADEIESFDEEFRRFWSFQRPRMAPPQLHGQPLASGILSSLGMAKAPAGEGESPGARPPEVQVVRTGASQVEVLAYRDLTHLKGDELPEIFLIAARLAKALPSRPGRRRRRHHRKGLPDLRGAFRLNLSQGGDLMTIPRRRRVPRVPRLLVLLDVSGSMDRYAKLLLQLVYALGQRAGRVETFVFSTSLTRVTRQLRAPSLLEALRRTSDQVPHWSGGTRIGECLATLNRDYAHLLDRDTSVLLMSDGWETGDPDHLARQLGMLRGKVGRLGWLNPLLGTQDYAPLTLGLEAARPHVDFFASAADLEQLKRLPRLLRS